MGQPEAMFIWVSGRRENGLWFEGLAYVLGSVLVQVCPFIRVREGQASCLATTFSIHVQSKKLTVIVEFD